MSRARLGALIAGGRARRLGGRPKGLSLVDGQPLIDRLGRLLAERCARVVIVGDPAGPYAGRGWPVIADLLAAGAPGGVYTALRHALSPDEPLSDAPQSPPDAPGGPGWVYTLACDMPRLDRATLDHLWAARGGQATLFRAAGRRQPLAALWHTAAAPVFEAAFAHGRPGFGQLLAELQAVELDAPSAAPFANLNTPADAARLGVELAPAPARG